MLLDSTNNKGYIWPGVIMSEVLIVAATIKTKLQEVAKQASALGDGLQNIAPGDKAGQGNQSVQYLVSASQNISELAKQCQQLIDSNKS